MRHVAGILEMTPAEVEDVATYYVMFFKERVGKYVLQVCRTLSCALNGAERVTEALSEKLGIKVGETDPSGMFTLLEFECLGACDRAPIVMVNNEHWHERVRPEDVGALVDEIKAGGPGVLHRLSPEGGEAASAASGCMNDGTHSYEIRPRAERPHARLLREARGVRRAEEVARHEAGRRHRARQGVGPARPRRRRVSDRPQVAVRPQGHAAAEVHLLQRGRERAGHVQGSRADGAQPAPALRGLPDRLLGDRREGRLHLHPRRVLPRAEDHGGGARQGVRPGLRRQEHHGLRLRLRHRDPSRRRRLRSGRGDRAHRIARRQARAAAHQAAVPGGRRASTTRRPRSTTSRRSATCRRFSSTAPSGSPRSAPRRTAGRSCSASAAT